MGLRGRVRKIAEDAPVDPPGRPRRRRTDPPGDASPQLRSPPTNPATRPEPVHPASCRLSPYLLLPAALAVPACTTGAGHGATGEAVHGATGHRAAHLAEVTVPGWTPVATAQALAWLEPRDPWQQVGLVSEGPRVEAVPPSNRGQDARDTLKS